MSTAQLPSPIFVLAAPALPGTTLAAALGRNPDAFGVPEINLPLTATLDAFMREMSGPRVTQTHGVLRALGHLYGGEQTAHSVEMARRWLDLRGWMSSGGAFVEIAAQIAPFRMVAPVTAMLYQKSAMKRLKAAFPEAHYVVLRAHPRVFAEVALGSEAGRIAVQFSGSVDESFEPPLPDPQGLWLQTENAIAACLGDVPSERVIPMRAETLVRSPAETLRGLAVSLGLASDEAAVGAMTRPEASVFAGPGPLGAHADGQIRPFAALAQDWPPQSDETLDGVLDWRPDGAGFREDVVEKAKELGLS